MPTTIRFTLTDAATGAAMHGAAVYVWHCDREGRYSMYSEGATDAELPAGVQADRHERCRRVHEHLPRVLLGPLAAHPLRGVSVASPTRPRRGNVLATSQIALTEDVCDTVYATDGYEQSRSNMTQVSLATDMVFSDGADLETPTVTGSVADGYVVSLPVRVA